MSNPKTVKAARLAKKKKLENIHYRFMNRNIEAMRFCLKNGLTVYPACQVGTLKVKLFRQRGENFLPLSEKLYAQDDPLEVEEYCAAIDEEYERIYLKMKDKV